MLKVKHEKDIARVGVANTFFLCLCPRGYSVNMYINTCECICVNIHVCIHVCMNVCVHIHICIYMYAFIQKLCMYMHEYIYIYK